MIFMCTHTGDYCQPLLEVGLKKPKSLVSDPTQGYLFYSDWSPSDPHIGRVGLDGSGHMRLVTTKMTHPNALTVDIATHMLYWADVFLNVVERCDYDGNNRALVAKGNDVSFCIFVFC